MSTTSNILETKRLKIVVPSDNSLANLYALQSDKETMQYIGSGKPRTKSETQKDLVKRIEHYQNYGFTLFDIFKKNTNEFIGVAGLIYIAFNKDNKDVEIGYKLIKKHRNKGYATELAQTFIELGFRKLNLKKIAACCKSKNLASRNVILKCNMSYSGKYKYNGQNKCDIYFINYVDWLASFNT